MNNLYLEAINAAEQIKLSAEEKVKQQIIESMSPQIKLMVEKKIMGNEKEEKEEECGSESNDECGMYDNDENESVNEITLDEDSRRILNNFISAKAKKDDISEKINNLKEGLKTIQKARLLAENSGSSLSSKRRINLLFKKIVKEIKNIKNNKIVRNNKTILKEYYKLIKELDNMTRRRRKLIDESLEDLLEMNLFEDEEEKDSEEEDSDAEELSFDDLGGSDDNDDDAPVETDEDDAPESSVNKDTTVEQLAAMAGIMSEDDEGDDEGEEPLDLEGIFETEESDMESDLETDSENLASGDMESVYESYGRDRVLEIDENMLRREIGRMKALREGEAKDMASHFGGGSLEGELFVDGVELNKLHEMKIKAAKVVRKNRMLESKLSQYKKALRGMKSQLTEMNLFNAKLLYANKLMQNRDLSIKQQRHIVESLDEAKTLGEAKILFESLSKSLVSGRPAQRRNNLTEGASRRPMSSSSRPVRSAQNLNESVALDRWATLAGIKK